MFDKSQYELIDFGDGKKLEIFSGVKLLRDCPAAQGIRPKHKLSDSNATVLSYCKERKSWSCTADLPRQWEIRTPEQYFRLNPTPFGHIGLFPEQMGNWKWLRDLPINLAGKKALNLFAYTGGTTMALASRGAEVTHVDSAKNIVRWASENAKAAMLDKVSIRWIVDDAVKFVQREIKRGNHYDIVVADPPAIGHSNNKMTWKFDRDIQDLIQLLADVCRGDELAVLLSCHTEGYSYHDLKRFVDSQFDLGSGKSMSGTMDLLTRDKRKLNCGHFFRWHRTA